MRRLVGTRCSRGWAAAAGATKRVAGAAALAVPLSRSGVKTRRRRSSSLSPNYDAHLGTAARTIRGVQHAGVPLSGALVHAATSRLDSCTRSDRGRARKQTRSRTSERLASNGCTQICSHLGTAAQRQLDYSCGTRSSAGHATVKIQNQNSKAPELELVPQLFCI